MIVEKGIFGELNGQSIKSYTIKNKNGMQLTCIDYGCIITSIQVPNREGVLEEVVLGYDTIEEYVYQSPYFGCVIGRIAGRIENASFELDGVTYEIPKNHGEHNLHGGPHGFDRAIWKSTLETGTDEVTITYSYVSPDGEEGFPGNLVTSVIYTINNKNELLISYHARSDKKTLVNLTNHTYFNLSGNLKRTILDHELTLKSECFLELDKSFIPSGHTLPVEGTVFDFTQGQFLSVGIKSNDPQTLLVGNGYDHPFILNENHNEEIVLVDFQSGRKLVVETDEPSVVVYTSNSLGQDGFIRGRQMENYLGVCLETQKPPNMIHHPEFPSCVLEPNTDYHTKTKYLFRTI